MAYHSLLEKQLKKLSMATPSDNTALHGLLDKVSKSYASFERDKQITEHAFQVSEKEYQKVLEDLRIGNELKKESIRRVKSALSVLDTEHATIIEESEDLNEVIGFLEEQIQQKNELSESLLEAKENAEKTANAKSNFLSVMSHEIRTPLNAIIGNIHILKQEEILPSQKEFIDSLFISSHNLLNLINDILDFSKIEDGMISFGLKPINIREITNDIRQTNKIKGLERENRIRVLVDNQVPEIVLGDDTRLSQILNNLVSNALKFTNKGIVDIAIFFDSETDTEVNLTFEVKDTGVGIKQEMLEKIFERFTQANSEITREYGGSGLGLTIIRKLLNLQNSEIHVESEEGKGSKFWFNLSFKKQVITENTASPLPVKAKENLKGVRVLLVEDVKFNIVVAKKMMQNWEMTIEVAENGQIALDKLAENNFDVILMDLQMPVMDGFTATKNIRKRNISTPIIALTASVSSETQVEVIKCGMNDYLTKPFNPKDLFRAIQNLVS